MGVCSHIFITSKVEIKRKNKNEFIELESLDTCFCVKCGESYTYGTSEYSDWKINTMLENLDYDFYEENENLDLDDQICVCDSDLALGIYNGIIRQHPDIEDEVALKYLKAALNNIRVKPKTEVVQKRRIKRLGLHPEFNKWQSIDVIHK